jgi:hypothetical protein
MRRPGPHVFPLEQDAISRSCHDRRYSASISGSKSAGFVLIALALGKVTTRIINGVTAGVRRHQQTTGDD